MQEAPKNFEWKPFTEMTFKELGSAIADGREVSTTALNDFLAKGIEHWTQEVERSEFFKPTFQELLEKYQTALNGNNNDRSKFCLEEAAYLLNLADELQERGVAKEETDKLRASAANWQRLTLFLTQY